MSSGTLSMGGGLRTVLRIGPWIGAAVLLLAPLIAMRFTDDVAWTPFDFALAGGMMLAVLIPWELAMRRSSDLAYLVGTAIALGTGFIIVWASGAVGIVGSEDNAANLMFLGVVGVAVLGAVFAGFRSAGMARALFATAAVQVLVGAAALIGVMGAGDRSWPIDVIAATAVFTFAWLLAGGLFRRSAQTQSAG